MEKICIFGYLFSLGDIVLLLTAAILLITAVIAFWYAWETRKMRKHNQRVYEKDLKKQKRLYFNYVYILLSEIKRTFKDTESIVDHYNKNQTLLKRLYYPDYDKIWPDALAVIDDAKLVRAIDVIYYRFYTINYNIDANRQDAMKAFAKYLYEIYHNYNFVIKNLETLAKEIGTSMPKDLEILSEDDIVTKKKELRLKEVDPDQLQIVTPDSPK